VYCDLKKESEKNNHPGNYPQLSGIYIAGKVGVICVEHG